MSGLPMMACNDRRPMLPVVHWITRNGRSALIGWLLCWCDWTHYVQRGSLTRQPTGLGVQPGELVLPVLLNAGGAPDLAARRGGDRSGRHQDEVSDIQPVLIGYRGGDIAFDVAEPAHRAAATESESQSGQAESHAGPESDSDSGEAESVAPAEPTSESAAAPEPS